MDSKPQADSSQASKDGGEKPDELLAKFPPGYTAHSCLAYDLALAHKKFLARLNAERFDHDSAEDQIALGRYAGIEEDLRRLLRRADKIQDILFLMRWYKRNGGKFIFDDPTTPEKGDERKG